jgi:archaellum component FlaC
VVVALRPPIGASGSLQPADHEGGTVRITEHDRHQLYRRLTDIIGPDEADTLMELLPPVGWAEVATKPDLTHQSALTDVRFDAIDRRFERVDQRFDEIDRHFDEVDRRFEQVDRRFEQVDRRFEQVNQRFDAIDRRFERVDQRLGHIEHRLVEHDARFDAVDARLDTVRASIEHLGTTTDLKLDAVEYRFISELHRTMRMNLLVTIGVLGTLVTVMAGIAA